MIENGTDTGLIENLGPYFEIFADWNLHDAELRNIRVEAPAGAAMALELEVWCDGGWRRPDLMDPRPRAYCVTLRFDGVRTLLLADFGAPRIMGALLLTALAPSGGNGPRRRAVYEPCVGGGFELECASIVVVSVVPVGGPAA